MRSGWPPAVVTAITPVGAPVVDRGLGPVAVTTMRPALADAQDERRAGFDRLTERAEVAPGAVDR